MTGDRLLVAALLRKEGQILLVLDDVTGTREQAWHLPGGAAGPNELLLECLQRVVREETGLEVVRVGELISLSQSHRPSNDLVSGRVPIQPGGRVTVFVFEVAEWTGELLQTGSDEYSGMVHFWPRSDAIEHLNRLPWRAASEPILAHLRGERADRAWFYRLDAEGQEDLVWPARQPPPEVSEQIRRARAIVVLGCIVILAILVIIVVIGIITLARPYV